MATMNRATDVLNNLLDKQYTPFKQMVNYGFEFLDGLERQAAETSLNGEKFYIPFTAKRQGTGSYMQEGGSLVAPRAINGETAEFDVTEFNDRLAITWKSLIMDKGNKALKLSIAQRLDIAIKGNREKIDQDSIYGNKVRGFINQRPAVGDWSAVATTGPGAGGAITVALEYDGDYTPFLSCAVGTPATWVPVDLVCADDYALIADGHGLAAGGGGNLSLYVAGIDQTAETVTIALVSQTGGGASGNWQTGGVIAAGYTVALSLKTTLYPVAVGTVAYWTNTGSLEMTGAFTNLFAQSWGGKDRSGADYAYTRAIGFTMANSGAHARAAFSPTRLTKFLAQVGIQGGKQPTSVWCNPLVKASYVDAVTTVAGAGIGRRSYQDKSTVDMVPTGLSIADHLFMDSKNMPLGILLFCRLEEWAILLPMNGSKDLIDWRRYDGQPDGPFWRDDASVASSVATLYGLWQLVAKEPNCGNGIINGIARV